MKCRLCGADGLAATGLGTCEDWSALGHYDVSYCAACGCYLTEPMLRSERDFALPPDLEGVRVSGAQRRLLAFFLSRRRRRIRALAGAGGTPPRLLDVGGGACAFANLLARDGHEVTVLEPNPANAASADVAAGVRFLPRRLDAAVFADRTLAPGSFDLVTMWHSLEHVPDPAETLRQARAALKPGGLLYVSVPNMGSLQARVGGNRWTYLDVPHHLTHFTRRGLNRVMSAAGFEEVRRYGHSLEYDVFGWFQTLLNLASRSHNYFYNRAKKGRAGDRELRHPRWTRFVTALAPLFLPGAGLLFLLSLAARSPSCLEAVYRPVNRS